MTEKERKTRIAESVSNYVRGRAMALSFKPLSLQDVRDAFTSGAEEMERLIDNSMWWKMAAGDELPAIDREVIALTREGKITFAHRPKEYWDGKSIATGEVIRHYPKRYGHGEWNQPDILYWLDIQLPRIEPRNQNNS